MNTAAAAVATAAIIVVALRHVAAAATQPPISTAAFRFAGGMAESSWGGGAGFDDERYNPFMQAHFSMFFSGEADEMFDDYFNQYFEESSARYEHVKTGFACFREIPEKKWQPGA